MVTNIDAHNTAPSTQDRFDLAIIGAGSAGFSAAITAAEQGARVALIGYGTIYGQSRPAKAGKITGQ